MPSKLPQDQDYDAVVVGSGITGGWAAKELTEKGLNTLVLERSPYIEHGADYTGEHKSTWELPYRGRGDRDLYQEEYPIQSQCYAFGEASRQFFVNDKKSPYTTEEDKPFLWIRGYHLGGRSPTWDCRIYPMASSSRRCDELRGQGDETRQLVNERNETLGKEWKKE